MYGFSRPFASSAAQRQVAATQTAVSRLLDEPSEPRSRMLDRVREAAEHSRRVHERRRLAHSDRAWIAAPGRVAGRFVQASLDGISRHISEGREELRVVLYPLRAVPPELDVTAGAVSTVEVAGVGEVQHEHPSRHDPGVHLED